jgi:hypothetical protein
MIDRHVWTTLEDSSCMGDSEWMLMYGVLVHNCG